MSTTALRLAYVCADRGIAADGTKGASVHFREMGRALVEAGFIVDGFVGRAPAHAPPLSFPVGFPVTALPAPHGASELERELDTLGSTGALLDALRSRGPHDAVYERFSLFNLGGLAYATASHIPYLVEVNSPLWLEAERYRALELHHAARALAREVFLRADHVLTVSEELRKTVIAEGSDPERVRVFPNGVNATLFSTALPASRPTVFAGKPVMVFIGSLKPWHGLEFLVAAVLHLAARRPLGVWIVGDGPLRAKLEDVARQHPETFVVEGAVAHERVPSILRAADIAVAPYPASAPTYFCPLKVVEALAAGCALVAADTPAVRELVGDPPAAELFAPEDMESFAAAVDRVLVDSNRRSWLRERGLARARPFTWTERAAEVAHLTTASVKRETTGDEVAS
ncbi:MAG: glycosyltransferase family 4 protein [Planctomycetota bacterium]